MSLSLFAVKNQWHKNGKAETSQVFGGSPKCSTASWARKDTTKFEWPAGSGKTNSTTSGSTSSTAASSKAPTWPVCWVSTPKPTARTATAPTVHLPPPSFLRNVQGLPGKHHQLRRLFRYVDCGRGCSLLFPRCLSLLYSLVLEQNCSLQERRGTESTYA